MSIRFRKILVLSLSILLLSLAGQRIYIYAMLNYANILLTKQTDVSQENAAQILQYLVDLSPNSNYLRWHAALALSKRGQMQAAADVMKPLTYADVLNPNEAIIALTSLVNSGQAAKALELYSHLSYNPAIPIGIAAKLADEYINSPITRTLNFDQQQCLFARSMGLDHKAPQFEEFGNILTGVDHKTLDESDAQAIFRQQYLAAMAWRSKLSLMNMPVTETRNVDVLVARNFESLTGYVVGQIQVGPELIQNGNFESLNLNLDLPYYWEESFMSSGYPWNVAGFVIGVDQDMAVSGTNSLRIDGLYLESHRDREQARAGLVHDPIFLTANSPYVVRFSYRTLRTSNDAVRLYMTYDEKVFPFIEKAFPATANTWQLVTLIVWNRSDYQAQVRPLLRSFSTGTVWFDDFSIREIRRVDGQPIPPRDPIIDIRPAE